MFGFFKKNKRKIEVWEKSTFNVIFDLLGEEYQHFKKQLPFVERVTLNMSDIPNLVSFVYTPAFYRDSENAKSKNYKLENIRVKDLQTASDINLRLYFAHQIFLGYSTDIKQGTFVFDSNEINLKEMKRTLWGEQNVANIKKFLTKEELQYINIGDVYVSILDGEEYFHLKEGEDGDFIGMNSKGHVFYITHDPFEIKEFQRESLLEVLKY